MKHTYAWASQVAQVVKNLPANAGDIRDMGSFLGSGRSPTGGKGYSLQYSCLEIPMDREAQWAIVHGVTESDTTEVTEQACIQTAVCIFSLVCPLSVLLFSHSVVSDSPSSVISSSDQQNRHSLTLKKLLPFCLFSKTSGAGETASLPDFSCLMAHRMS